MIEKWVIFKRDYLEISFLRENCGYDGSDERRRLIHGRKHYNCLGTGKFWYNLYSFITVMKLQNFELIEEFLPKRG